MRPNFNDYDVIVVNSSGGKDSQTMLRQVVKEADAVGFNRSNILVAHADLGRAEWAGTREVAEAQAKAYGLRFEAITRPQGDLLTHIEERGMWPSSTTRYCTSDHKRDQVQKIITKIDREHPRPNGQVLRVLNCMGLRAEESPARAKRVTFENNKRASTKGRQVDNWLPIHEWLETEVWADIKASGIQHHRAYDLGMTRLSCVFCIFAPKHALVIAGKHNPELLDEYVAIEQRMGHTFRKDFRIAEVKEAIHDQV